MRKSQSTPNITSLALSHSPATLKPRTSNYGLKRNAFSCQALPLSAYDTQLSVDIEQLLTNKSSTPLEHVAHQLTIEALVHAPAYTSGMCFAEYANQTFPTHILNDNTVRDYLLCMSTPHEHQEEFQEEEFEIKEEERNNGKLITDRSRGSTRSRNNRRNSFEGDQGICSRATLS